MLRLGHSSESEDEDDLGAAPRSVAVATQRPRRHRRHPRADRSRRRRRPSEPMCFSSKCSGHTSHAPSPGGQPQVLRAQPMQAPPAQAVQPKAQPMPPQPAQQSQFGSGRGASQARAAATAAAGPGGVRKRCARSRPRSIRINLD